MKILIVEDDQKIASFLKKGLIEEYFIVDITDNGDEAIYLASIHQYDVIILDLMIFGCDGYEVCKKLRIQKVQTPIIILSAKSTIDDKVSLLNLGADDYLTKPFSFDELLARIRVHLRKKEQKDNILTIADLQLNLNTKMVKRGENLIKLTAKEYVILEYLLRNKGCIIDEATLQNSIASFEEIISSNTVNVYIYRLRTKIDKEYEPKLIKTYRNQGFSINEETL
ncbi:MAG: response regulator transcription factor [Epsilonproteobacteria bacterium]|nr:response regulator transcription factor [Campylobacterota bacterium]